MPHEDVLGNDYAMGEWQHAVFLLPSGTAGRLARCKCSASILPGNGFASHARCGSWVGFRLARLFMMR